MNSWRRANVLVDQLIISPEIFLWSSSMRANNSGFSSVWGEIYDSQSRLVVKKEEVMTMRSKAEEWTMKVLVLRLTFNA